MREQKDYWDKKIKAWTDISYQKNLRKINLLERLANLFRGQIGGRMRTALEVIGPMSKNKTVVDLGCGLGDFCFEIIKYGPKKVIGIDISSIAIKEAEKIAKRKGIGGKVSFKQADIGQLNKMPNFDIAVGLGFIDYLPRKELKGLFNLIRQKKFFFSFFEKKLSLKIIFHSLYVKLQGCPGAFKYSRREIKEIIPVSEKFSFFEKDGMVFITNLFLS